MSVICKVKGYLLTYLFCAEMQNSHYRTCLLSSMRFRAVIWL